ncbi:class I SAM-dependent methyltransferase [Thalassospira sp.]|uniref:class I SAM-dependent methyltransferase n=1 Tax=Thalassospira sp. TaxID=1912094 RepID=UPI003AA8994E
MNTNYKDIDGYKWKDSSVEEAHDYILPKVQELIFEFKSKTDRNLKVFDLGCGNGAAAHQISQLGFDVIGVDPSQEGISIANQSFPHLTLQQGSAYDDLTSKFGTFDIVISLEVVEHVYAPRVYAKNLHGLVKKNGIAIISTPFHGYWKNLAIAAVGGFDKHFTALWDHGHIKFWSIKTLTQLLTEAGFSRISFYRVGRIPLLAKSMIAVCHKD